ncbi:MAG: Gfo/Idh/MocA family oxidoreductase [Butyrivibrio sp.]|uniref:Gfo/Idh/MocA family protein n=1 Tax=Butyrivibrio sp. TaxID=28121 RepID=UPI0025D2381A|nr:Gfo/Idh/MocA family oxidoreductase [Butyrivibrio sp.]MCR5770388.1 Gfo/Idh/MocA family oxidoreductase [Butyrivibrio sp.]
MDKIRYGIIGIGAQGSSYARFLTGKPEIPGFELPKGPEHATLGAICDIDEDKKAKYTEIYKDIPFYTDWKELVLSGNVDAVITTVPHYLHTTIAIFCLEHGVPVLVEKPAGVYAKAVREMNECALKHPDVAFGIMFNQRTNVLYKKIREIINSGEMGQIRRSNWIINTWYRPDVYYRQSSWRATWEGEGGGVLVNQAPHQLDLWQWICGIPTKVFAKCRFGFGRNIDVEDDVTIMAEFENGAVGTFITCTHDACGTDRLEIDLDGGKIVVEDSKKATIYRLKEFEQDYNKNLKPEDLFKIMSGNGAGGMYETEEFENTDGWGKQHITVLENFACHILEGTPLLAPGTDGINGVNLCNATLLSAWLSKEVDNPVDEDLYYSELQKRIEEEKNNKAGR